MLALNYQFPKFAPAENPVSNHPSFFVRVSACLQQISPERMFLLIDLLIFIYFFAAFYLSVHPRNTLLADDLSRLALL